MAGILLDAFHQNLRKKYIVSPYCVGIVNLLIQILIWWMKNYICLWHIDYYMYYSRQFQCYILHRDFPIRTYKCAFHLHWDKCLTCIIECQSRSVLQIQIPIYSSINSPLWTPTFICTICFSRYFSKIFHEVMSIDNDLFLKVEKVEVIWTF